MQRSGIFTKGIRERKTYRSIYRSHEILEILRNNNVKIAISSTRIVHSDKLKKLRYIGERGAYLLRNVSTPDQ